MSVRHRARALPGTPVRASFTGLPSAAFRARSRVIPTLPDVGAAAGSVVYLVNGAGDQLIINGSGDRLIYA